MTTTTTAEQAIDVYKLRRRLAATQRHIDELREQQAAAHAHAVEQRALGLLAGAPNRDMPVDDTPKKIAEAEATIEALEIAIDLAERRELVEQLNDTAATVALMAPQYPPLALNVCRALLALSRAVDEHARFVSELASQRISSSTASRHGLEVLDIAAILSPPPALRYGAAALKFHPRDWESAAAGFIRAASREGYYQGAMPNSKDPYGERAVESTDNMAPAENMPPADTTLTDKQATDTTATESEPPQHD